MNRITQFFRNDFNCFFGCKKPRLPTLTTDDLIELANDKKLSADQIDTFIKSNMTRFYATNCDKTIKNSQGINLFNGFVVRADARKIGTIMNEGFLQKGEKNLQYSHRVFERTTHSEGVSTTKNFKYPFYANYLQNMTLWLIDLRDATYAIDIAEESAKTSTQEDLEFRGEVNVIGGIPADRVIGYFVKKGDKYSLILNPKYEDDRNRCPLA